MIVERYVNGKKSNKTVLENITLDISKSEVVSRINVYTEEEKEKSSKNVKNK